MKSVLCFIASLLTLANAQKRKGMALCRFGGGIADMRGSIGGTVFSRTRFGATARNRTTPVDPGTSFQMEVRAIMGQVRDAFYNTLTAAQRTAWTQYANNVSMSNRLGEPVNLTNFNHYVRTNVPRLHAGLDRVDDGPALFTTAEQDGTVAVSVTAATKAVSVAFDDTLDWLDEDGGALVVYESAPMSPNINYFKGPFRYLGVIEGDGTTPPTTPAAMTSAFEMTAGQKQFFQFRILRADGRTSSPFRVSSVIG